LRLISKKYGQNLSFLLIFLLVLNLKIGIVSGDLTQAHEFYNVADQSIKNAFTVISRLNIDKEAKSFSVNRLNQAVKTLDYADHNITAGNFDNAIRLSQTAVSTSLEIEREAKAFPQENTEIIQNQRMIYTALELLFVSIITYTIWILIKRLYTKRILTFKPEVIKNEH